MNSKEIETREQEGLEKEIRDLVGEHWPLLVGLVSTGALLFGGVYVWIKLFKKRKGELPEELEQITSEIEAMAAPGENKPDNLFGVVKAIDIGEIVKDDKEAQNFVTRVITTLGYPSGGHRVKDFSDECVVACAGLGGFLQAIFKPSEKEK